MSVYCIVNQTIRLDDPTKKLRLQEPLAYTNQRAHAFRVTVVDADGEAVALSGVGCVGQFMKLGVDETVAPINGTVTGNVAEVVLPASCYVTPGRFRFTMDIATMISTSGVANFSDSTAYAKGDQVVYSGFVYVFTAAHAAGAWTGLDAKIGTESRTALWVEGIVERNMSGTIIDPGTPVGNIAQAINDAETAAAAASEAAAEAQAAIAEMFVATVSGTTLVLGPVS